MADVARVPAAVRYKEITAAATSAAQKMREHENAKVDQLEKELAVEHERRETAERERQDVLDGVRKRWNRATDAARGERWLQIPEFPEADRSTAPRPANELIGAVQSAFLALHDALGKNRWPSARKARRNRE